VFLLKEKIKKASYLFEMHCCVTENNGGSQDRIGSGAVDRRKRMYADSEMSFFGRENLRNSAFQRGKTLFI